MSAKKSVQWTGTLRWLVLVTVLANLVLATGIVPVAAQANPHFAVWPEDDHVAGWEWQPDSPIDVTINGNHRGTVSADGDGNFSLGLPDGIQVDDVVTVFDGVTSKVHQVTDLAVTGVDPANNTVSGTAEPESVVSTWIHGLGDTQQDVTADATTGAWSRDFGPGGLFPGANGPAVQYDNDGDATWIEWTAPSEPLVIVNQTWDQVQGRTPQPDTWVDVTLLDPGDGEKGHYADWSDGDGWFGNWCLPDTDDNCADIEAGDTVTVDMEGTVIAVPVNPMNGAVDAGANSFAGQVLGVPFPASVRGEVWVEGGPSVEDVTDGSGNYTIDFNPFDVAASHEVSLWYIRPDGHEVGIVRSALRIGVGVSDDNVWGNTAPGAAVDVAVSDASGPKGSGTTTADDEGNFHSDIYLDGERTDILPGDTVQVTGGGETATVVVPDPFSAALDADTDTVSGEGPAGAELRVDVYGYGDKWVTVEPDGTWSVPFGDRGDLQNNDEGDVRYYTAEGHEVQLRFRSLALNITVDYEHDWVNGNYEAGHTVWVTVYESDRTTVKATAELETGPIPWWDNQSGFETGWEDWDPGPGVDIEPGDWVYVELGNGYSAEVEVGTISGEVDLDLNTVSGSISAAWHLPDLVTVNCEIHEDNGPSIQIDDVDPDGGTFDCDFDGLWEIELDHNVAVNYLEPDGDRVQTHLYAPFLQVRVNESHNWVSGETTPGSRIVATVWRDGLPVMAQKTDNGGGTNWQVDFCCGEEYELRAGDWIEVETSQGLTAMVEIVPVEAVVDAATDRVTGRIHDVDYPADVRVEIWQEGGESLDVATGSSGDFEALFPAGSLHPANMVFIANVDAEGHEAGIIRHALQLRVHTDSDVVNGFTAPDAEVAVTLNGGETVLATSSTEEGYFAAAFDGDIGIGDLVAGSIVGQATDLTVADVSAVVDEDQDKVWGYGPPYGGENQNIEVCLNDDCRGTRTDETSGYYEAYFGYDISAADRLQVIYNYPEGHRAYYGFGEADVRVDKWAPIYNIAPGDEFIFYIRFNNDWSGTATNVQIVDTLPEHVSYVPHAGDLGPAYDPGTHTLTWNIGTLGGNRGRDKEIELHLRLDNDPDLLGSRLTNEVEISADNDRDPGNNSSQSQCDIVGPGSDFWVDKELVSGGAVPGGTITYRVRFGNRGNRDGVGAVLTDLLPANATYESSTSGTCPEIISEDATGNPVVWILDTLPPSEDAACEFELSLRVDGGATPGSFLTNELAISDDVGDWFDNRNNRRVHSTVVQEPESDLWVDKAIEGDFADMGSEIVYRITFRNDGNTDAQDVSLVDTLPLQMERVWHSAGVATTGANGAVSWDLGTVPAGAGGMLLIGAQLAGSIPEDTVMTNRVEGTTSTSEMDTHNNVAEAILGPPIAIAVPWVGSDPHRAWDGMETTLKGVARGYGLTEYEWDFGDGSPVESGWIDDPYAIEARHTYVGEPGDTFVATLTVRGAYGWEDTDEYYVGIFDRIHGVEKGVAIDEALWFQHKAALRYRRGGLPYAEWGEGGNQVAQNVTALQAFQIHGHLPGGDPLEDPYVEDVRSGWNAALAYTVQDPASLQPAGNPDSNGNGAGIGIYEDYNHSIYEAGLAMMALASTGTSDAVAHSGPVPYVRGRTYQEIAQDMADWFAWGQNDADLDPEKDWARGGWRYQPNSGDSDNSNTQFPVLGLAAAEDNWGVTVPVWVKDELRDHWLLNTQNENGAFGYSGDNDMLNVGKTGAGIMDLIWTGVPADGDRVTRAAGYIEDHWNEPMDENNYGGNVGDFYAMYAVKKGSHLADFVSYGPYYWDLAYTRYLIDNQQADGRFDEDRSLGQWFGEGQPLATSWALLILSEGLYESLPVAIISPYQHGGAADWFVGEVQFDGTLSHHTNPDRAIVQYDWDFGDGGTATNAGSTPFHTYVCQGEYPVTLTVTDDDDTPKSDQDTLLLTVEDPWRSVGPIEAPAEPVSIDDQPIQVSAAFSDGYPAGPHTAVWEWGDGTFTQQEDVASPVTAEYAYEEAGVYKIRLTVTDGDCEVGSAEFKYVVVYDPSDGFVTGGGWIWSQPGWCQLDELCAGSEGKASFGFVSKYKKGAKVPTGNTQFNYSAGGLNFHSDTYDWLVINRAGSNAQYKGKGTINGNLAPNDELYKFMIWARDLDPDEEDTFRIKIWYEDSGEVVAYDNGHDQPIDGGNITVHAKK